MTTEEYNAVIEALGLSQGQISRVLGVDRSLPYKWAKGTRPCQGPSALALGLLLAARKPVAAQEQSAQVAIHQARQRAS